MRKTPYEFHQYELENRLDNLHDKANKFNVAWFALAATLVTAIAFMLGAVTVKTLTPKEKEIPVVQERIDTGEEKPNYDKLRESISFAAGMAITESRKYTDLKAEELAKKLDMALAKIKRISYNKQAKVKIATKKSKPVKRQKQAKKDSAPKEPATAYKEVEPPPVYRRWSQPEKQVLSADPVTGEPRLR